MATYQDICEEDKLYVCDNCEAKFKAKEVRLEPVVTNVTNILTPSRPITIVDENGTIKGVSNPEEGDNLLACPRCGHIHLFGFNSIS